MHSRTLVPGRGELARVGLGPAQRRLQHRPDRGEARSQRAGDAQRGIGGPVVLGVDGHGRARVRRGDGDPLEVLGRDPLAQRVRLRPVLAAEQQPEGGRLHRDLDRAVLGQPLGGELAEQVHVLGGGRRRALRVGGVLAEVVERHEQPGGAQFAASRHRVLARLTGHVPVHDGPRRGCPRDRPPDPFTSGSRHQRPAEHKHPSSPQPPRPSVPSRRDGRGGSGSPPGGTATAFSGRPGLRHAVTPQRDLHVGPGLGRDDDLLRGSHAVGKQRSVRVHGPLDQAKPDRPELEVPGGGADEPHLGAVREGQRRTVRGQPVHGAVQVQEDEPPGRVPEVMDPRDRLLAAVAALVQVHGGVDQADLVRQGLVVGVEARPRRRARRS